MSAVKTEDIFKAAAIRAFDDPTWFFTTILMYPILPWQLEACEAVLDVRRKALGLPTRFNHKGLPRISIRSCHGPGKTQLLALIMHLWNFITRGKIACTAPKEAQLLKRLMPRYRSAMRDSPSSYKAIIKVQGKEVKVFGDPDWGSVMETATDPENLAGYHDTPQLFLVDEASAKRLDPMFPVIEGALTTPGSVCVEIGNPTRVDGEFYNHHNKPGIKELYYLMHVKPEDAPGLISKEWIDNMRIRYGETSPIFLIRALGEFAAFDEYVLIPVEYIDDAFNETHKGDGSHPKLRVTVDVADGGADASIITVALHYKTFVQILNQKAYYFNTGESPIKLAKAAISTFKAFGGDKHLDDFVVDGLGVGAGCVGRIMEDGYNVINYKGGEASSDPSQWRNLRVQCYISLYNAYRTKMIYFAVDSIDDEEELRAQLLSIKRNPDSDKFDDIMPKKTIKKSPDRADSLKMQFVDRVITADENITQEVIVIESMISAGGYDAGLT